MQDLIDIVEKLKIELEKKEYDYADLQSRFDSIILYVTVLNGKYQDALEKIKKLEEK